MEDASMAYIKRIGNSAVISGKNAEELFEQIKNTPAIDFKKEIKEAKSCRVTYSEMGIARILKRVLHNCR